MPGANIEEIAYPVPRTDTVKSADVQFISPLCIKTEWFQLFVAVQNPSLKRNMLGQQYEICRFHCVGGQNHGIDFRLCRENASIA